MKPFFSIVIPLYNKENYVADAIWGIMAQTFADFEVVIVDDASTDDSLRRAKDSADNRFRLIAHEKNKGLSASRNTGIRAAVSDFIVFLDADDKWQPDFLERIKNLIDEFPQAGLFATAYQEHYPGGLMLSPRVVQNAAAGERLLISDFFARNTGQPIYNHSSVCIRRSLFDAVGFYDEDVNFSEDVEFNVRANYHALLAFDNTPAAVYNAHSENQITASGIGGKSLPRLDGFHAWETQRPLLKKYLDFERYVLAKHCKLAGRTADFNFYVSGIDRKNLKWTQRILLGLPASALRQIRKLKTLLLLRGRRVTTY
jgi:glycosyltransferase involved in cell wall biosynthesis